MKNFEKIKQEVEKKYGEDVDNLEDIVKVIYNEKDYIKDTLYSFLMEAHHNEVENLGVLAVRYEDYLNKDFFVYTDYVDDYIDNIMIKLNENNDINTFKSLKDIETAIEKDVEKIQDDFYNDLEMTFGLDFNYNDENASRNIYSILEKDGLNLEELSDEFKSYKDVVLTAVKQNGSAIQFASDELRNKYGYNPKDFIENVETELTQETQEQANKTKKKRKQR